MNIGVEDLVLMFLFWLIRGFVFGLCFSIIWNWLPIENWGFSDASPVVGLSFWVMLTVFRARWHWVPRKEE